MNIQIASKFGMFNKAVDSLLLLELIPADKVVVLPCHLARPCSPGGVRDRKPERARVLLGQPADERALAHPARACDDDWPEDGRGILRGHHASRLDRHPT